MWERGCSESRTYCSQKASHSACPFIYSPCDARLDGPSEVPTSILVPYERTPTHLLLYTFESRDPLSAALAEWERSNHCAVQGASEGGQRLSARVFHHHEPRRQAGGARSHPLRLQRVQPAGTPTRFAFCFSKFLLTQPNVCGQSHLSLRLTTTSICWCAQSFFSSNFCLTQC